MAIIPYLIFLFIAFFPLLLGAYMCLPKHSNKTKTFGILLTVPFFYLIICILLLANSQSRIDKKKIVLSGEKDFLLGTDYIYLLDNKEFVIEYADHIYNGTYEVNKDRIKLDININLFAPLRESFPNVLINDGTAITDTTGNAIFDIYP